MTSDDRATGTAGSPYPDGPYGGPEPESPRPRTWVVVFGVLWGLVLAGTGLWAVFHDRPTVRGQTTIVQAEPTVNRAIAEVLAGDHGVGVIAISGYDKVADCQVTVARSGARYQRTATIYTTPGSELALLRTVAAALPASYHPSVAGGALPRLGADAGDFVSLSAAVPGPGQVRFVADTGCRPQGGPVVEAEPASATANRAPAEAVLTTLGVSAAQWHTHRITCLDHAPLWTVEATAGPVDGARPLDVALRRSGVETPVVAQPNLYAFRSGTVDITVRTAGDQLVVTATTPC